MPCGSNSFRLRVRRLGGGGIRRVQVVLVLILLGPRGAAGRWPLGARLALGLGLSPPLDAVGPPSGDDLWLGNLLRPGNGLGSLGSRVARFLEHVGARDPRWVRDQDIVLVGVIRAPLGELLLRELLVAVVVGTELGEVSEVLRLISVIAREE